MIGAVVLVVIAIVLIPAMLSGPRAPNNSANSELPAVASADESKVKTYTIDLSKSASRPPAPASTSTPVGGQAETPKIEAAPDPPAAVSNAHETKLPDIVVAATPKQSTQSKPEIAVSKPTAHASPVTDSGWTVQVGSFSARASSERIAQDLKRGGFPAFVVAFQSGDQTMYRVRVGPVRERPAAEVLLRKLKSDYPNATLVAPP